jgi:hypothetical protein
MHIISVTKADHADPLYSQNMGKLFIFAATASEARAKKAASIPKGDARDEQPIYTRYMLRDMSGNEIVVPFFCGAFIVGRNHPLQSRK